MASPTHEAETTQLGAVTEHVDQGHAFGPKTVLAEAFCQCVGSSSPMRCRGRRGGYNGRRCLWGSADAPLTALCRAPGAHSQGHELTWSCGCT